MKNENRTNEILKYIARRAKECSFEDFDKEMINDGNKREIDGMNMYSFGITIVGQMVVEDIFNNPEAWEKQLNNG